MTLSEVQYINIPLTPNKSTIKAKALFHSNRCSAKGIISIEIAPIPYIPSVVSAAAQKMNVEAISVTPTLNYQSLIIVPDLFRVKKDIPSPFRPQNKATRANWYLLYLRAHPRSMLNNASHAQGERAVDRIDAHAIVSNVVSTFRLFPSVLNQTPRPC